jgi:hypothetical protein
MDIFTGKSLGLIGMSIRSARVLTFGFPARNLQPARYSIRELKNRINTIVDIGIVRAILSFFNLIKKSEKVSFLS